VKGKVTLHRFNFVLNFGELIEVSNYGFGKKVDKDIRPYRILGVVLGMVDDPRVDLLAGMVKQKLENVLAAL